MTDPSGSFLEAAAHVAGIIEAFAVTVGVVVTVSTIDAWRKENIGKRKLELAENTLLAFYEVSGNLKYLRTPLSAAPDESPVAAFERHRSQYYNRLTPGLDVLDGVLSGLAGQQALCRVYFGSKALGPFDDIMEAARALQRDIRELFTGVPAENKALKDKSILLSRIGWGEGTRPDVLDNQIRQAVVDIEAVCKPVVRGRR